MTSPKRLDDIRGANQPTQPRKQKPLPPQPILRIKRPAKITPSYKLSFLKIVARKIWHGKMKLITITLLLVIGIMISYLINIKKNGEPEHEPTRAAQLEQIVITNNTKLVVDFTFNLKMIINNQPQAIPADYGKTEQQRFIFNTDTSSGDIHVQSPNKEDYRLRDFFVLWGSQFNSKCLLNHCLSGSGSLTMTVNGKINSAFDSYIIKPDDQIVIIYNNRPL